MSTRRLARLACLFASVAGCGAAALPAGGQPPGWDDDIRLAEAIDLNSDPGVVELNLRAAPGTQAIVPAGPTPIWGYDGTLPGPLIRAHAGDRVIVHFTNELPDSTTVHWHGLRIPAAMDGMPDASQSPVPPGGSFDYDFVVPDASTFWYHPHVNAAAQLGEGLYGAFIVEPPVGDPQEPPDLGDEVVLILSDIALDGDGSLLPADSGGADAAFYGREGNVLLVNGRVRPTLRARPGLRQRWRIINAAKSRYFQIALAGHGFERIGGDGGLLAAPIAVDQPVLAPAERADLLVVPQGAPGSDLVVQAVPYDRGLGTTGVAPTDLFVVHLQGEAVPTPPRPTVGRAIAALPTDQATAVDLTLTSQAGPPVRLGFNGVAGDDAAPLMAHVGETQVWTITNTMAMAHPIHLHGFFFQTAAPDGSLEWKDTVSVPADGTVKLTVRFDDRPGMWMFHCHILDHAEMGMAGMLMVMP